MNKTSNNFVEMYKIRHKTHQTDVIIRWIWAANWWKEEFNFRFSWRLTTAFGAWIDRLAKFAIRSIVVATNFGPESTGPPIVLNIICCTVSGIDSNDPLQRWFVIVGLCFNPNGKAISIPDFNVSKCCCLLHTNKTEQNYPQHVEILLNVDRSMN